ncbi:hypothetical protein DL89DRAFT_54179 [Linderina pennispora]|uniref:Uncharacterized protein n=1 Tax=Linderina pennispora TaxID=61395 RepID=A0A1Y1W0Z4_9FUNG|nr:uncharacterized protein DL89DRAFT_54179 [Linderina pennispora]ORX67177.1 hypothetical protein DL89DRAFT_54179 [Linderina pennispora]
MHRTVVPSMFQQTPGSFDSFNAPATGMGVPLSNYRLSAVNSSEFKNPGTDPAVSETTNMPHIRPAHESLFSSGLFLGASAKLHPTLRTSSGIFSNVRGTDHSAFPQISLDHKGTNNSAPKSNPIDCRSSTTSSQSSDYSNDDTKTAGYGGSTGNAQFVNPKTGMFSLAARNRYSDTPAQWFVTGGYAPGARDLVPTAAAQYSTS